MNHQHEIHIGTGLTIKSDKRQTSAEIEQQTHEFLSKGGKVERLASEQMRPVASPAFNPGMFGQVAGE